MEYAALVPELKGQKEASGCKEKEQLLQNVNDNEEDSDY